MREVIITHECLEFIDNQEERVVTKFFQLIEVIGEIKIVHTNFVKKILTTQFYELRIKAGNEYRIVMFAVDHLNFAECKEVICLYGFHKKSNKDYKKATKQADKILNDYLKENK